MTADPHHPLLAGSDRQPASDWADTARVARAAADDLHRVRRELPEHWRAGRGRDDADETLRRVAQRLEAAAEAYRLVAEALAARDRELTRARAVITETLVEARRVGLVVTPEGAVTAAGSAPMAVRALARRLSAVVAEAVADAAAARARAADLLDALPSPH
ncbi:hypothetical protein [Micromonospora inositola]|uniref:Uncharacterized protein n=1 Tax=Micromonospora inositola TaxID=47865 RepID=A0A1C5GX34_9ACTN|nr:hypothetical protein [Micromonospora inositola]SCG38318.1 hypothetical protein GA0070613_0509 [Micromonospora inositola]